MPSPKERISPPSHINRKNRAGPNIAHIRATLGLSHGELAERCRKHGWPDAHRLHIFRIEKGLRGLSDLELVTIAEALGVHVTRLLGLERK